ncbi:C40 family peptidase [Variovorax boronicumulans]|uniref:C40 family peptidase n=1 Tax=Variovorax boronicumulans TaxID=436515 RepID=UPI0027D79FA2|nr:C40 family peptidase [Variovorax boronicumulans]
MLHVLKRTCNRVPLHGILFLVLAGASFAASSQVVDARHRRIAVSADTGEGGFGLRASTKELDLVRSAKTLLGVPYRFGGNSEHRGFDCSGFTRRVFEMTFGLVLPRRARDQASMQGLLPVRRRDLEPGDLVFFNTREQEYSHVGIYLGDDKFIHSPRSGAVVRIDDMNVDYWSHRFTGARRAPIQEVERNGTSASFASSVLLDGTSSEEQKLNQEYLR